MVADQAEIHGAPLGAGHAGYEYISSYYEFINYELKEMGYKCAIDKQNQNQLRRAAV